MCISPEVTLIAILNTKYHACFPEDFKVILQVPRLGFTARGNVYPPGRLSALASPLEVIRQLNAVFGR